ncbi:MAG: DUF177 domain-containing protein [Candidatus Omnitrophota bacterium]
MKIKINDVPKEGLELKETQEGGVLDLKRDDLKFISPILLSAFITVDKDDLYAHVWASGRLEIICGRCLSAYELDFKKEFDFSYDVKGKKSLDITDDIRQEIILEYPLKSLCKTDCKGLCSVCGKNLNEGDCGHKPDSQKWDKLEE